MLSPSYAQVHRALKRAQVIAKELPSCYGTVTARAIQASNGEVSIVYDVNTLSGIKTYANLLELGLFHV